MFAVAALGAAVASALVIVDAGRASAAPGAGDPFDCSGNFVYSIDYQTGRNMYSVPTADIGVDSSVTASVVTGTLANSTVRNALAIVPGGAAAYYLATIGGSTFIYRYDPVAQTNTQLIASPVSPTQGGAYDPGNGLYYFGNTAINSPLYAYNPATNVVVGQVGTLPANATSASGGGDFAFDNAGDFFWTNGGSLYNLPATAVPATAGTGSLANATLVSVSALGNEPGIAFDPAGHLYEVTQAGVYSEVNPITGATSTGSQGSQGTNLSDMAGCNPPSSLTVRNNLPDRTNPGDQFTMRIAPAGGTAATVSTSGTATGLQSASVATVGVVDSSYTVSETAAGTTNLANYTTVYACTDTNHPADDLGLSGTGTSVTFLYPAGDDRRMVCTFTNTPKTATLSLTKALSAPRSDDTDQFTVAVHATSASGPVLNPTTASTTTGTGGTVDPGTGTTGATTVVATRTYYLTEAMAAGSASQLAQYTGTLTCVDSSGQQTGLPSGAAFTTAVAISPVAAAVISCTLSNTVIAPTLSLTKSLGSARLADTDQFTVAVHTGSATGPVVTPAGNATTSGTGATVTPGSGTTGTYTATAGTSYYLTETSTGNAARYGARITCTDANGFQTGLPTAATFTGSLQITPVAGAAISCTLTNALTAPALTLSKINPSSLTVGVPADYTLTVVNLGGQSSPARVLDRLPANLQYVSTAGTGWSCTATGTVAAGQLLTCTSGAIVGGTSSILTVTVLPTAASAGTTVANKAAVDPTGGTSPVSPNTCTGNAAPTAGCAVPPSQVVDNGIAVSLAKTNPASLTVGVASNYTLTVTNDGTGPATSATVADLLADGLHFNSATGATCTAAAQLITCTVPGPLAAGGGTTSFTISVTPTAAAAGTDIGNAATVDPDGGAGPGDPSACTATGDPAGCAVTPTLPVGNGVALALAKTDPVSLAVGVAADYTLTVTNDGTGPATSATVTDLLPDNLVYNSATGASCSAAGQLVTCTVSGPISAGGASLTFTIDVTPGVASVGTTVANQAAVDPTGGAGPVDPSTCTGNAAPTAGCAVSASQVVGNGVSLALTKANPAGLTVGVASDYSLTVTNNGTGPAPSATFADLLPNNLTYNSATGASCTVTGQLLTCTVPGPIAAGGGTESVTLSVTPTAAAASSLLTNRASVDPSGGAVPVDPAGCTGNAAPSAGCAVTSPLVVGTGIALTLTKTNPSSLTVGVAVDYTLTVTNNGTGPAATATVTDLLPNELNYNSALGASCVPAGQVITCTVPGPLAPAGGSATFTINVTPLAPLADQTAANTAAVDATGGSTPPDPAGCSGNGTPDPGCAVTPALPVANGVEFSLDEANPANLTVGVATDYTLTVTNNGTGPVPTATVVDLLPNGLTYNSASGADCTAIGQTLTCTVPGPFGAHGGSHFFTVNVTPQPSAAGQALINKAAVDPAGGTDGPDPASCIDTGTPTGCAVTAAVTVATAQLHLVKTATPIAPASSPVKVGDRVGYAFLVTNASQVAVTDVQVQDPTIGPVTCPLTTLDAGQSTTCTGPPHTVIQTDVDAGNADNTATASATLADCVSGCALISPSSEARTATLSIGALTLTKAATLTDANHDGKANAGETITYVVTITNTGTVTLSNIAVHDVLLPISCSRSTLAVGTAMTCTAVYTVTAHDEQLGAVHNTATATADTPLGQSVTSAISPAAEVTTPSAAAAAIAVDDLATTGYPIRTAIGFAVALLLCGPMLQLAGRRRRRM